MAILSGEIQLWGQKMVKIDKNVKIDPFFDPKMDPKKWCFWTPILPPKKHDPKNA